MSTKNSYNYIVIGNNNTALATANLLSLNSKVALVFEQESSYKAAKDYSGEFEYIPNKEDWLSHQDWLNTNFDLNIESTTVNNNAKTVDSGNLTDFLGFGDREGLTLTDLSWYNEEQKLKLTKNKFSIQEHLLNSFKGELINNAELTDINITDSNIDHIILNGQKKLTAEKVIFCNPPNHLLKVMDVTKLPAKFRQKITKQKALSTLQILYRHKNEFEYADDIHFLMGNKSKSEFEPTLGYFWKSDEQQIFSQWLTLIPSDQCEDIENVGAHLKNIKRQIKRAYPHFFELIEFEKVFVKDQTHGFFDIEFKDFGQLKGINNLILGSPLFSKQTDLYATVEITQKILEQLSPKQ